jgi:hypothetical protein
MKGSHLMNRIFGPALFAVLAMSALLASAASAGDFHSEVAHTTLTGSQIGEDVFNVTAGTVKCKEVTYSGTQSSATTTTVTVKPTYSECTAFTFVGATIDTNGCEYEFSGDNTKVNIVNCGSTPLTVTGFNCWVTVGNQNGLESVTYTNEGAGSSRDVRVSVGISNVLYTQHTTKTFPGCSNSTMNNGSYIGAATLRGFNTEGAQVGVWRQ